MHYKTFLLMQIAFCLQDSHRNATGPAGSKATPMSAKAAQRNTVTNYFPVLQDGSGSRGSEQQAAGGGRPRGVAAAAANFEDDPPQQGADAWHSDQAVAELHERVNALEGQLERTKQEADSLRWVPC